MLEEITKVDSLKSRKNISVKEIMIENKHIKGILKMGEISREIPERKLHGHRHVTRSEE